MSVRVSVTDRARALAATLAQPRQLLAGDRIGGPAVAAVTVLEHLVFNPADDAVLNGLLALVLAVLVAVVVTIVRRHFPIGALLVAVVVSNLVPAGLAMVGFASYGVGYRVVRVGVTVAVIGIVTIADIAVWLSLVSPWDVDALAVAMIIGLVLVVPALFGRYHRQRAALVMSGWERAERLERERAMTVEQARLRERTRIAREMHDSLGHDLSLIALQAGALELDPELPERYRETARTLRATTTEAMERLRDVIGVLREDRDAGVPTEPAGEDLTALVERAKSSGVDVCLEVSSAADAPPAPPLFDRAIYYVVREAITNATKHAPGTPITVRVTRTAAATTATVRNPLPARPVGRGEPSAGTGLISLTERMRLVGGDLRTSSEGGAFTVTATVPHDGPTGSPADGAARAGETVPPEMAAVGISAMGDGPNRTPVGSLPKYEPSVDELTELYDRTAPVGRLRRRLWLWLVLPMTLVIVAVAVILTYVGMERSTMPAATFESLRIGQSQEQVERLLPTVAQSPPVLPDGEPDRPDGATCRYYAPRRSGWMWPEFKRTYRICFADGRLVGADVLHHPDAPRTSHQAGARPDGGGSSS